MRSDAGRKGGPRLQCQYLARGKMKALKKGKCDIRRGKFAAEVVSFAFYEPAQSFCGIYVERVRPLPGPAA